MRVSTSNPRVVNQAPYPATNGHRDSHHEYGERCMTMIRHEIRTAIVAAAAFVAAGCAVPPVTPAPNVPAAIRAPAGHVMFWEARATGVQIYECAPKSDASGAYEWAFRAPEASLADRVGKPIGRHYGGPSWEANDGSKVVGEVKARTPGPDASAIPWLLLSVKSIFGKGVLTQTANIQRVDTVGGLPPNLPCDAANAKRMARVPYTATYYFFREPS